MNARAIVRVNAVVILTLGMALAIPLVLSWGKRPHCYFGWTEGNPFVYLIRYIHFGEGDTARSPERSCAKPSRTPNSAPPYRSVVDRCFVQLAPPFRT
jgi:hypothetical protein